MASEQPHAVALAFLTQGHINPLLIFCSKLAASGIRVTFITVSANLPFLTTLVEPPPLDNFSLEKLELPEAGLDMSKPDDFRRLFESAEELQEPFEKLIQEKLNPLSCIISDCMYRFTLASAKKFGVPRISFWTTSATSMTIDFNVRLLQSHGDIPVEETNMDKLIDYVPGLSPIRARDLPYMYHAGNMMTTTDPGYARKIARSVVLKEDRWVVLNTFEELESETLKQARDFINRNCICLASLLPSKVKHGDANSKGCIEWLNTKPASSVVFVAFGSAVKLTGEQFEEMEKGLEKSGVFFLWSLGKESTEPVSSSADGRGMLLPWAPQVEVLGHPSVGAFITHCGWNSVLESVYAGVPMLGLPRAVEQNLNCKVFIEDHGIGVRLELYRNSIAMKVRAVLRDEKMKQKAAELGDAVKRKIEEVPLDKLVNEIKRRPEGKA